MNFSEKISYALDKMKMRIIVTVILFICIVMWGIAPFTAAFIDASLKKDEADWWDTFFTELGDFLLHPVSALSKSLQKDYIATFGEMIGIFAGIFFLFLVVGVFRAFPTNSYQGVESGSSDWSTHGEQYKVLDRKKGIVLAEHNYLPVDKRGNVNVLIVGGSGAGKSASYVIPNALQLLGSYVFTDPKGELYDKTAGYFREKGYSVKVLNLVRPQNSDGYNPLHHITNDIDVDIIAHTIVKGQGEATKSSDPFWDDMSEMLMKALIYYLMATRPPEEQSLASCSELVRCANSSGGDSLLSNLMNDLPLDHPARMYYKNIEMLPEKTFGSVLGTLQSKLGKFDSKEIAEVTSTDTIDFKEIGSRKTVLYVISSDTHTAYDFLLTIFFSQMIQQMYDYADEKGGTLPIPTYFILDEFANIGQIPDFDKKISTSRSRKISFSVILQNLDQLEAVYKESYETIIGNCDTHVFLGSNSQKTVEYFSKALGEKTIERDSVSVNKDRDNWKTGKSVSDQVMARALMTADELRRMDDDMCIIFEKGIKPIKANKYYYFKYPEGKIVQKYYSDHNDVNVDRGVWRKFNPYNPYSEEAESDERNSQNLSQSLEDLDNLFSDDEGKTDDAVTTENTKDAAEPIPQVKSENSSQDNNHHMHEKESSTTSSTNYESNLLDIQKELEAKFDELFGSDDD